MRRLLSVSLALLVPFPAVGQSCSYAVLQEPADSAKQDAAGPCPFASGPEPRQPAPEETVGPNPPIETADSQPAAPEPRPPVRVDPRLVNKKVVVYLRDGRVYRGKLIKLTGNELVIKNSQGEKEIPVEQVETVQRESRSRRRLFIIAGAIAAGFLIATLVANAKID